MVNRNWVISETARVSYHTNLTEICRPLEKYIDDYNWLISNIDCSCLDEKSLPFNLDDNYCVLSGAAFKALISQPIQFFWAVVSAIPKSVTINIQPNELPFADGNDSTWTSSLPQHTNAEIEIICWDSSFTIIKFVDTQQSQAFKHYFPEAEELADY